MGGLSYITGSHNIKGGVQDHWGPYVNTRETNGDLQQVYAGTAAAPFTNPVSVTVYNTPLRYQEKLNADVGIFVPGFVGAEPLHRQHRAALGIPGARSGRRRRPATAASSTPGSSTRFPCPPGRTSRRASGVVYDLFGNAKTALKAGLQPLQRVAHDPVRDQVQPAGADLGDAALDRPQRRRHRAGRAGLRLPERPAARSTSPAARQLRHSLAGHRRP